jgi:ABC-type sugar transport system permease subunit
MEMKNFLTMRRKRAIVGLIFISPWLIGFIWFYVRSLAMSVMFSLSDVQIAAGNAAGYTSSFAGIEYYRFAFLEHGTFTQVFSQSMINIVIDVPLIIFFSLFIAILLNRKFRGRTFVRIIFFLPVLLNSQAITTAVNMARAMLVGGVSPASSAITEAAGMGATANIDLSYYMNIFSQIAIPQNLINYIIGVVSRINNVITASGVQIIIFLAALQSVPGALYEVAKIEGATAYETFWKVTLPIVSPLIVTNIVYTVIDSFVQSPIVELSYNTIFTNFNYPLGSTMSLVSTVAVCLLLLVVSLLISKLTYYEN